LCMNLAATYLKIWTGMWMLFVSLLASGRDYCWLNKLSIYAIHVLASVFCFQNSDVIVVPSCLFT
jgi:hypothetical protein